MNPAVADPHANVKSEDRLRVGTLVYTKLGLVSLFAFLLWGDFCFTLMEHVVPAILPLRFKDLDAPNWVIGLILTTIPNLMNMVLNPVISFRSDRFRSRWGRRIPFLVCATPFVCIFLVLLGYSEQIGRWTHRAILQSQGSEFTVILVVIAVLMIGFKFFDLFISSVYYYLFNDVVPAAFLARFLALFKMVGIGAYAFFSFFLYKYATTHMAEIFLGVAVLYLVGFSVMCWRVKEGEYPPPPPNVGNQSGFVAAAKTYGRECFTHRFYWYFFLANSCSAMGWAVTGVYDVLLATEVIGMPLDLYGKVNGIWMIIALVLLFPAGLLADKLHPLRVFLTGWVLTLLVTPLTILFLFNLSRFPKDQHIPIWITLLLIAAPLRLLSGASELPMYMRLLPKERYGQFASANALIRSVVTIAGGIGCGLFLDYAKRFGASPGDCYRFVPVWNVLFFSLTVFFLFLLHREWKRLGGMKSFEPPAVDASSSPVSLSGT